MQYKNNLTKACPHDAISRRNALHFRESQRSIHAVCEQRIAENQGGTAEIVVMRTGLKISGLMFLSMMSGQAVLASVTADPTAPAALQPQIQFQNNTQIVNITTPNNAGVSTNHYQHFDVDAHGVVLNNGTHVSGSVLAGQVAANQNLTQPAKHIVNNVKSGAKIKGTVEVAGTAAHVTVATPYGIEVDNGDFINTEGVTLSTGHIVTNQKGELIHQVGKAGKIAIGPGGLKTDKHLNLYTRRLNNEGPVSANGKLHIETGVYDLNIQTGELTKLDTGEADENGTESEPFVHSVSSTGTLTGSHIQIVANEKGFGVNLEKLNATDGSIHISADGKVTLGHSYAKEDIHVAAKELHNQGQMLAGQDVKLNIKGKHINTGQEIAMRDNIQQAELLHNQHGILSAGRDTHITADNLDNEAGKITALHDVTLNTKTLMNRRGKTKSVTWREYEAGNPDTFHEYTQEQETTAPGEILAGHDINLNLTTGHNQAGTIHAEHIVRLKAKTFTNSSDYLKTKDEYSYLKWKNKVFGSKRRVTELHNSSTEEVATFSAGQGLDIQTQQFNNSGKVKAQNVDITSEQINNGIFTAGDLTPSPTQDNLLSGGEISGGQINIKSQNKVTNQGYIVGDNITIETPTLENGKRTADYYAIEHGEGYWVEISGQQVQDGGVIAAKNKLNLKINNHIDKDGSIYEGNENQIEKVKENPHYQYQATRDAFTYSVHKYKQDFAVKAGMVAVIAGGMMICPPASLTLASMMTVASVAAVQTASIQVLNGQSLNFRNMAQAAGTAMIMNAAGSYTDTWGKKTVSYAGTTETNLVYKGWNVETVGARLAANGTKALTMGVLTDVQGGKFSNGFNTSLAFGLGTEIYSASVGHFADATPGKNRASPEYTEYNDGRVPREFVNGTYREYNNIGLNDLTKPPMWQQNGPVSNFVNHLHGLAMNAIGTLHDQWMNAMYPPGAEMSQWMSVGTMLPAAAVTYSHLYEQRGLPVQEQIKRKTSIAPEHKNEK